MSEYHAFYEIDAVGATLLWDIWCSHDPLTVTELLSYDFSDELIRRQLMYYASSDLILPVQVGDEFAFLFNPVVEWSIAVGELVRNHTKEELKQELRQADASERVYTDLYDFEDSQSYYEEDENSDVGEMVDWFVAECRKEWVADAIEYYSLIERLVSDSVWSEYQSVSITDVEKQFVSNTEF